VGFVTFLLNPGPTTACRKSMSHSQPLFVAGTHINTLLRTHVQEITSNFLAWLFSSCSRTFRSWNRLNSKHFLSINMQQSYRLLILTASSDTDFISFGEYYEYIKTVESTRPRAKNVGRSGAPFSGGPHVMAQLAQWLIRHWLDRWRTIFSIL